jgi:hypothetical protein
MKFKAGYRIKNIIGYQSHTMYKIGIEAWTDNRFFNVYVNDEKVASGLFFAPVHQLDKISFRTGTVRRFPNADTPTDQNFDVPQDGMPLQEARFNIYYLKTNDRIIN